MIVALVDLDDLRRLIAETAVLPPTAEVLPRDEILKDDADLVRLLDDLAATAGRVGLRFPEVRDP